MKHRYQGQLRVYTYCVLWFVPVFLNVYLTNLRYTMTSPVYSNALSLTVNTIVRGTKSTPLEMRCMFTYSWDALTGAGSAQLLGINGSMLALTLYLEPEVGKVRFTSNIQPTRYAILGNPIYLKKVVLEIHESGETAAALFFNTNDALVQATTNFNTASL